MSMNLAYELATANDADTKEILDNTILLLIPSSNPDGIDIVANWYRKTLGTKSEGTSPPELYHHYAGHDDNRDWFMLNLEETRPITKLFWQEWFPQIVYDVHQMGQNGVAIYIPAVLRSAESAESRRRYFARSDWSVTRWRLIFRRRNRRRRDELDLRHVVARRISLGSVLSQLDRHFV